MSGSNPGLVITQDYLPQALSKFGCTQDVLKLLSCLDQVAARDQLTKFVCLLALKEATICASEQRFRRFAALAVWDYAEASACYIFRDALDDNTADSILDYLRSGTAAGPFSLKLLLDD